MNIRILTMLFGILLTSTIAFGQSVNVFQSGSDGYHTFRIPALVTTGDGTLLAFAEGRRGGRGDGARPDVGVLEPEPQGEVAAVAAPESDEGSRRRHLPLLAHVDRVRVEVFHCLLDREVGDVRRFAQGVLVAKGV